MKRKAILVSVLVLAGIFLLYGNSLAGVCAEVPGVPNKKCVATKDLKANVVKSGKIADDAVTGDKVLNDSLTASDLAPNAVGSAEIANGSITQADIGPNGVCSSEIGTSCVGSSEIGPNAVGSSELQEGVTFGTTSTYGDVRVFSSYSDRDVVRLVTNTGGAGYIATYSPDGQETFRITTSGSGNARAGLLEVNNSAGQATVVLDGSNGVAFASAFQVWTPAPAPNSSDRMIQYSSLVGPEAAIYLRGRGELAAGRSYISFPDHFSAMVVPSSITVSLTPRSADSAGLAAVEADAEGMEVVELGYETGSYFFDYVVYGVRKGHEDYEVYMDASAAPSLNVALPETGY